MEEKERYVKYDPDNDGIITRAIYDTIEKKTIIVTVDRCIDLLNQQSKRIKELCKQVIELNKKNNILRKFEEDILRVQKEPYQFWKENQQLKQQVEELKGKRLEFYNDDVRQTQVINGVHFDTEQLLVFSEYVEHEKNISADKDKQINQLKQQLHDLPKKIVGEIQENFDWKQCCEIRKYYDQQYIWFNYVAFNDFLDTILKKYGGEDESLCCNVKQ